MNPEGSLIITSPREIDNNAFQQQQLRFSTASTDLSLRQIQIEGTSICENSLPPEESLTTVKKSKPIPRSKTTRRISQVYKKICRKSFHNRSICKQKSPSRKSPKITPGRKRKNRIPVSDSISASRNSGRLDVVMRIRPLKSHEKSSEKLKIDDKNNQVSVVTNEKSRTGGLSVSKHENYSFGSILPAEYSQEETFQRLIMPRINNILDMNSDHSVKNLAVLSYGCTGSGKTFTLLGNETSEECSSAIPSATDKDAGMLPRTIAYLFDEMVMRRKHENIYKRHQPEIILPNKNNEFAYFSSKNIYDLKSRLLKTSHFNPLDTMVYDLLPVEYFGLSISMVEIYNENINDLLDDGLSSADNQDQNANSLANSSSKNQNSYTSLPRNKFAKINKNYATSTNLLNSADNKVIYDDANGLSYIHNVKKLPVGSIAEAMALISAGRKKRHVASTLVNSQSSRAHCLIDLWLMTVDHRGENSKKSEFKSRRLTFIDLAGAERAKKTDNRTQTLAKRNLRIQEAGKIHSSLLALSNVIRALKNNSDVIERQKKAYQVAKLPSETYDVISYDKIESDPKIKKLLQPVPFRQSKLTRLLQNFFYGENQNLMIVNISLAKEFFEETCHVLNFSNVARSVKNVKTVQVESTTNLMATVEEPKSAQSSPKKVQKPTGAPKFRHPSNQSLASKTFKSNSIMLRENKDLKKQLQNLTIELTSAKKANQQLKTENQTLESTNSEIKNENATLKEANQKLLTDFQAIVTSNEKLRNLIKEKEEYMNNVYNEHQEQIEEINQKYFAKYCKKEEELRRVYETNKQTLIEQMMPKVKKLLNENGVLRSEKNELIKKLEQATEENRKDISNSTTTDSLVPNSPGDQEIIENQENNATKALEATELMTALTTAFFDCTKDAGLESESASILSQGTIADFGEGFSESPQPIYSISGLTTTTNFDKDLSKKSDDSDVSILSQGTISEFGEKLNESLQQVSHYSYNQESSVFASFSVNVEDSSNQTPLLTKTPGRKYSKVERNNKVLGPLNSTTLSSFDSTPLIICTPTRGEGGSHSLQSFNQTPSILEMTNSNSQSSMSTTPDVRKRAQKPCLGLRKNLLKSKFMSNLTKN